MDDKDEKKKSKKIGTMDIILIIVGVFLLTFTVYMIYLFKIYGAVPDLELPESAELFLKKKSRLPITE